MSNKYRKWNAQIYRETQEHPPTPPEAAKEGVQRQTATYLSNMSAGELRGLLSMWSV